MILKPISQSNKLSAVMPLHSLKKEVCLKKCVEDCINGIQKESQRYQELKAHTEEKLWM